MAFTGVALFNFEREFSAESNPVVSQAVKQSCEQQQRDVYESHRHRTFSLAFYMTGNEMEAEEILATTFVRAFQQNEQPDGVRCGFSAGQRTQPAISSEKGRGRRSDYSWGLA